VRLWACNHGSCYIDKFARLRIFSISRYINVHITLLNFCFFFLRPISCLCRALFKLAIASARKYRIDYRVVS